MCNVKRKNTEYKKKKNRPLGENKIEKKKKKTEQIS